MAIETDNYVSIKDLSAVMSDKHMREIRLYEECYKKLLSNDDRTQFRKTFYTLAGGKEEEADALLPGKYGWVCRDLSNRLSKCDYHRPCRLYICPACRKRRQLDAGKRVVSKLLPGKPDNFRFVTLLLPAVDDIYGYHETLRKYKLDITRAFNRDLNGCSLMGAFEIDHKIKNQFWFTSPRTKELYNDLGINDFNKSWFMPHLHMIAKISREQDVLDIRESLSQAVYKGQHPARSIRVERFRPTKPKSYKYGPVVSQRADLRETLVRTAHYIFKARLQYTFMQYEQSGSKGKTKRTAYSNRMFSLLPLLEIVDEVNNNGGFKGLKFDYKMVKRSKVKSVLATTEATA